jgi:D-sedoheptulose 7-phosphate isomerase
MSQAYFKNYFDAINNGLNSAEYFFNAKKIQPDLFYENIFETLNLIRASGKRVYFFGNGASSAFANHMALDFSKNGRVLSKSLSDSSMITALANDFSFEVIFTEYLKINNVEKDDLIITISSSGNSPNIINLLEYCCANNIKTLSLSGLKPDNLSIIKSHYAFYVPMKTYGIVECIHQIFLHLILDQSMSISEWDREDFQNMSSKFYNL